MKGNRLIMITGISGAIAIALGAMGAHTLKERLTPEMLQVFDTAAKYQMYHTIGLLGIAILMKHNDHKFLNWAGNLFITGIILFSGSLYFLSTRSLVGIEGMRWIGAITPLGGLAFISGWLLLSFTFYKKKA